MHEHNTPPCLLPQLNKFEYGNESTLEKESSKKRKFTECELEVLLSEVETRKNILFGTLSSGINDKRKKYEWESLADVVHAVGSENRTVNELKKKWSDIKVEVKRRTAAHRQSVGRTGGGTGVDELTAFEQRVASIMGDTLLSGAVSVELGDSDLQRDCCEGNFTFICLTLVHITYQPALKFQMHYLADQKYIRDFTYPLHLWQMRAPVNNEQTPITVNICLCLFRL